MEQAEAALARIDQLSKVNKERIDKIDAEIADIKNDQKAIYKIATSVEVMAERIGHIEEKVDSTNSQLGSLSDRVSQNEKEPLKRNSDNVNTVRMCVITGMISVIISAVVNAIVQLIG